MRKLVLNTLTDYLTEAALSIDDVYNKYYQSIDRDVFNAAVAADPTSYNQGKVVKVGNFVKWILKLYQNNAWKPGDSYETKELLTKFVKYKSKLPLEKRDINRYNSIHDLYSIIQTLESDGVKTQSDVKREGAEVVYEDSEWKIVIPHTEEASCIYGANTRWCTAGREDNMFDYYNKKGPLYININKQTGDKYQFHFESGSFMDAADREISPSQIGLSKGAIEYYKSIGKEYYFIYDKVGKFFEGFAKVYREGKYNFINKQGELLWDKDEQFDDVGNFFDGFARVKKEGKYNWINTNGELLWKEDKWFDDADPFRNGFARVKLDDLGWNLINRQGELLWKEYKNYDEVGSFYNGFARVRLEGKGWNFINTNGEYLWKKDIWFDKAGNFSEGFASVYIKGRGKNFINTQGELLWKGDKGFDFVWDFCHGFAKVRKKRRGCNFINKQGELLWEGNKWFDDAQNFYCEFTWVYIDNKSYKLNTKGELYDKYGNRVNIGLQESKRRLIKLRENDIHKLVIKTLKEYLY